MSPKEIVKPQKTFKAEITPDQVRKTLELMNSLGFETELMNTSEPLTMTIAGDGPIIFTSDGKLKHTLFCGESFARAVEENGIMVFTKPKLRK